MGVELQKESVTLQRRMVSALEYQKSLSDISKFEFVRDAFTANSQTNQGIANSLNASRLDAGKKATAANDRYNTGTRESNIEQYTRDSITRMGAIFKNDIPEGLKSLVEETSDIIKKATNPNEINSYIKNKVAGFDTSERKAKRNKDQAQYDELEKEKQVYMTTSANQLKAAGKLTKASNFSQLSKETGLSVDSLQSAVGIDTSKENQNAGKTSVSTGNGKDQHLVLDISGLCVDCGKKIHRKLNMNPHNGTTNPIRPHGDH